MLCAEKPGLVEGLLLFSYPLHPPGKPQQLRTQHLPKLSTPALFVQGTGDPFGSIEEIESALKLIPGKTEFIPVEAAGHDLNFKKGKTSAAGAQLVESILSRFKAFFGGPPAAS
jgi:predicted alpha/beta-hydrolase family hydrolase